MRKIKKNAITWESCSGGGSKKTQWESLMVMDSDTDGKV